MDLVSTSALLGTIISLALATTIAVLTSYYFYRWRRTLTFEGKVLTIPEELIATIAALSKQTFEVRSEFKANVSEQKAQAKHFAEALSKTNQSIGQLFETTVSLQRALDQRDAEIDRLRAGYDTELIRRFITRFIRVRIALVDSESPGTSDSNIAAIRRLLDDALDECGVESFKPKIGDDFRSAPGVADNPRVIPTADASQNFKIVEILDPGYKFRTVSGNNVILPARVSINVMSNSGA